MVYALAAQDRLYLMEKFLPKLRTKGNVGNGNRKHVCGLLITLTIVV